MILFIHSFQVLNTLSCMVLTAVNADVGGHFNIVIGLLVFRRRRYTSSTRLCCILTSTEDMDALLNHC